MDYDCWRILNTESDCHIYIDTPTSMNSSQESNGNLFQNNVGSKLCLGSRSNNHKTFISIQTLRIDLKNSNVISYYLSCFEQLFFLSDLPFRATVDEPNGTENLWANFREPFILVVVYLSWLFTNKNCKVKICTINNFWLIFSVFIRVVYWQVEGKISLKWTKKTN